MRHLHRTTAAGEATGKVARRQGLQVGPTRQLWVDRLESARGLQQYGRGRTAVIAEERELSPHELDACSLKVARRTSLGDGEKVPRRGEGAGLDLSRRSGHSPLGAANGIERQRRCALEKCGRGGNPTTRLGPAR